MINILLKHHLTETVINTLFQNVSRNFKPLPKFYVGQHIKLLRCIYHIASGELYHTVKNTKVIGIDGNQLILKLNRNSVCSTDRLAIIYNAKLRKYEKKLIPMAYLEDSNESYRCCIDFITEVIVL